MTSVRTSSYMQLLPLCESELPCMPDLADDGPDMLIHPCTKAFMARSVRRVFPFPLGPQKMSKSVCSPNCSVDKAGNKGQAHSKATR